MLKESAQAGEIELAYVDAVGFSCVHPNRSAWTKKGEQHHIPAIRGARLNVLGLFTSSGYFESTQCVGTIDAEFFITFIEEVFDKYDRPMTIILDNASIHKAKKIQSRIKALNARGLTFYFIPPYSPELNRIEIVWRLMKHSWMDFKCRTIDILIKDVTEILENFGLEKYKFSFY